ncbi:MAG TPA: hypothetical protein EYH32_08490 [Anaerolineae bacterium]|nr:hypothetical protein [Anaerolineae bacterium]
MLAIAVFVVAYPLFQNPAATSLPAENFPDEGRAGLLAHRDATYAALKELEMDHEMGKLALADYQALRDQYRAQAVAILQELDSRQVGARDTENRAPERKTGREILTRQQMRRAQARCPDCGWAFEPEDLFCRRCGANLREECK